MSVCSMAQIIYGLNHIKKSVDYGWAMAQTVSQTYTTLNLEMWGKL